MIDFGQKYTCKLRITLMSLHQQLLQRFHVGKDENENGSIGGTTGKRIGCAPPLQTNIF